MKIIIPTNDRETIAVHTGRCKEFGLYEIENENVVSESFVPNPHSHQDEGCCKTHSGEYYHDHSKLVELFSKGDLLMYYAMGKRLRTELEDNEISFEKASSVNIQEIIDAVLKQK
ncbi:NifB/NifX family molybdenum-iron cluster-binding protein [Epilithonimonas hungarica]|uniref:Predicted Fe-Mo cluster-binding protein, NifX family n=1 Tax=Epilithonimonas hungarica TaxID=454006 RepID=A0A1G7TJ62_9FLAO|nr:NifB/NifX family molybdenum-iron cluster-binding protein [Epilithonimonas hungarica]SDG35367.1 Predicted Fe-Mo cluster-binding protein, NifX family [Epilithonimonas hungarica]